MIFKAKFLILVISTAAMEAQQQRESEFDLLVRPNHGPVPLILSISSYPMLSYLTFSLGRQAGTGQIIETMDTSISDSESSKIRTLLITMAFMRTNTGTPNVQMSPMLPLLLMNSDLSTDNDIVMMALLIGQLGNNQTQDSFSSNGLTKLKKKGS